MSVCGIDFGNLSILIAQAGKGGVDVILNGASNRQNAAFVSFQDNRRYIGDAGAVIQKSNIKNTISCMKLFVGRKYDEEDVQRELSRSFFKHSKMTHGGVGIHVNYNNEEIIVSPEHLFAILLKMSKEIAYTANNDVGIAECVLAVPSWFTDAQRRAITTAAEIAELNVLKVMNESTAVALSYGIYKSAKKLFSETEPVHVMFIDLGYTCYSVTTVSFIQEKLQVLATVTDRNLGGRVFDDIIVEFLCEQFEQKHKINVRKNPKALLKLETAAEKAKKTLSPNGVMEARISVECLAEDIDLNCVLMRDEFEKRCGNAIAGLSGPIHECLREAGLSVDQISEVEVVGGSTRVNIVKKVLGEILKLDPSLVNYGLKTTMNSDEAVARGTALQCAILSSRVKVKPFNIIDKVQYPIEVNFNSDEGSSASSNAEAKSLDDGADGEIPVEAKGGQNSIQIYSRGDDIPRKPRRLTFRNKVGNFSISLDYTQNAALTYGTDHHIATYDIIIPSEYTSSPHDISCTFNFDKHNMVVLTTAHLMKEVVVDDKVEEKKGDEKESEEKKDTNEAPKKKFRRVELEVKCHAFGLSREVIKKTMEIEAQMANEDRLLVETANSRNALEAYIYSMRDRVNKELKDFGTNSEKIQLQEKLTTFEDWLYNDGFESTKNEYTKRLDDAKKIGNVLENRLAEESGRTAACDNCKRQIEMCRTFASSKDAAHDHITDEERALVRKEADVAEEWYYDMLDKQGQLASYENPVMTIAAINARRLALYNVVNPIMTKPKPKPKVEEKKESESKADEKKEDEEGKKENEGKESEGKNKEEGDESVPMDV